MGLVFAIIYIVIAAQYVRKYRPTAFTFTNWSKLATDVLLTLGAAFTIVPVLFCLAALKMLFGLGLTCMAVRNRR